MPAMTLDVTEGTTFAAWLGCERIIRSRADNATEREGSVTPAMQILEAVLGELGFAIIDRQLVPVGAEEEGTFLGGRISTLPAEPEIDNTLPPEGSDLEKPPPGTEPPLGETQSAGRKKRW